MDLNDRQRKIITIMLKQFGSKSIADYASITSSSERTIYNDLNEISNFLPLIGYELIKEGSLVSVERLPHSDKRQGGDNFAFLFSNEELRRIEIFYSLIFESNTITYSEMANHYFISKTSLIEDVNFIRENFLVDFEMVKSDNLGTKIIATESDIQKSIKKLSEFVLTKISIFSLRKEYDEYFYKSLFGAEVYQLSKKIILDYIFSNVETVDEFYIESILNVFIILVYRLDRGFHIEDPKTADIENFDDNSYKISKYLLESIKEVLSIEYHISDLIYLSTFLQANKITYQDVDEEFDEAINILIHSVSKFVDVNLLDDEILKIQLENHFGPMFYRIKNNLTNPNPFNTTIIEKYFLMNGILWYSVYDLEKKLEIKFTQDEISFLVIYFQLAMERKRNSKRVLIVCPLGISTSHILENEIRKILPPIDAILVKSLRDLRNFDYSDIDLIITTIRIENENIPQLLVSPILTSEDKKNILSVYEYNFIEKSEYESSIDIKEKTSNEIIVLDGLKIRSKQEFITHVSKTLLKDDYVNEKFIESMIAREQLGNTDFQSGVAIPHGIPDYIHKSAIFAFVNDKRIKWENEQIYVVLVILLKKEDMSKVKSTFKQVYRIIKNSKTVDDIFKNKSKEEIEERLREYL